MNRNIKRIIVLVLVFGAFSAIAPVTSLNLLVTKAYATDDNTEHTLDSLKLLTSSGSNIKLYSDDSYHNDDKVDSDEVKENKKYYAKTSSRTISLDTNGPSQKYIKVFKGTSKSTKGKSITSDISLSSGTNNLVIRVYNAKPDSDVKYDDDTDVVSEYTLRVKYTGEDSKTTEDSSDNYDDIYLDKLSVDSESISLSKSKVEYTYSVSNNIDKVKIKAVPEDDNYTVRVNGSKVDEDESYKATVSLSTGVNEITVKVEDEDNNDKRVYKLKITRGNATDNTKTNSIVANNVNKWVQENGVWKYYDVTGNALRNSWFYDKNYSKTYYLQWDGSMALQWLNINGKWYYFGQDGGMKIGWIIDNGKYYYLYSDGSMAANTSIGLYRLGSDGAWISR